MFPDYTSPAKAQPRFGRYSLEVGAYKRARRKKANPQADTSKEECIIDLMVYHLYGLIFDEAKIIDAGLREEDFNNESK